MTRAFQLAVVNSHPIQYFAPLYSYLSKSSDLDVTALYCSDFSLRGGVDPGFMQAVKWDIDLLSGYRSVFLGSNAMNRTPSGFWSLICPQVWQEIRKGEYDAVLVHGYSHAVNLLAFLAAKSKGIPVFLRSETHHGLKRSGWKLLLRDSVLSLAYRAIDGFLAIGTANRAYYQSIGIPEKKIFDVPYTVDNDRFIFTANDSLEARLEVRKKYGLPLNETVILFASKLITRKHPDALIRAMEILRNKGYVATLFLVGTGEMEDKLKSMVNYSGLENVVFGGFINQLELPKIFSASDIFVLPAESEPWGLIINEVMCAGIPVIVSDEVGCVLDLVKDGVNGYHIRAGNEFDISKSLEKLLVDESLRLRMGEASLEIIKNWSYKQCLNGILKALRNSCHLNNL